MKLAILSFVAISLMIQTGVSLRLENLQIPFEDCGSQFELLKLTLSTCIVIPCNVEKGNFVTFTAEFDASNSAYSANLMNFEAQWIIDGIVQSAILLPSSCDNYSNCPGVTNYGAMKISSEVFVSNSLPKLKGIFHFVSKNSNKDVLMCYRVPVAIS